MSRTARPSRQASNMNKKLDTKLDLHPLVTTPFRSTVLHRNRTGTQRERARVKQSVSSSGVSVRSQ